MAYVLGFIYADGCVLDAQSSRTQYLMVASNDVEILKLIRELLGSNHPMYRRAPRLVKHKDNRIYESKESFRLRIGSREIYQDLIAFGLHPNKSKTILLPIIPTEFWPDFIRGYFDGDGCVSLNVEKDANGKEMLKRLLIIFTSGSYKFLEALNSILTRELLINEKCIYQSSGAFQLRYSTNDSIKIFKFLYSSCPPELCLERKLKIFSNYFNLRPSRVDLEVASILNDVFWPGTRVARERSAKPSYMGANPIQASKF